ncbi:hypothetical protein AAG596_01080 [Citromicrobium bathyomarinum]|uniref:hypothetical protein n=1 Tax=Citromicrobium bathyomarinum TaxID=72174 RepID=UPI00315A1D98
MTTNHTGGYDARLANALALQLELGIHIGSPVLPSITFAPIVDLDLPKLEGLARTVAEDARDCLVSIYDDETAIAPAWHILLYRQSTHVLAAKVVPAAQNQSKPVILMHQDRANQFVIDQRGILQVQPIEPATKRPRAHQRAAERIAATAQVLGPMLCAEASPSGDTASDDTCSSAAAA